MNTIEQLKLATEGQPISCVYLAAPYSSVILLKEYRRLLTQLVMTFGDRVNYVSLQPSIEIWKYLPPSLFHADKRHGLYPVLALSLPRRAVQTAKVTETNAPPPESHIILTLNYQAKHLKALAKKEAKKKAKKKKKRKLKKQGLGLFGHADKDEVEEEPANKEQTKKEEEHKAAEADPKQEKKKPKTPKEPPKPVKKQSKVEKKEKKDKHKHIPDPDEEDGRRVWFSYTAPSRGELDNRERFLTLKNYRMENFNKKHFVTANARDIIRWQIVTAYNDFLHRNPHSESHRFFGGMGRNNLARMGASNESKKKRVLNNSRGHYHRSHYAWFHPEFDGALVRSVAAPLITYKEGVVHYRHRFPTSNWDLCFVLLVPTVIALKLNNCRPLRVDTRGSKEVLNVAGSALCELLQVCGYRTIASLAWYLLDGGAFAIVLVQWCLFYYYGDLLVDYIIQRFSPPEVGSEDLCFYLDDFIKRGKEQGKRCNAIRALQSREASLQSDLPPHHVPLYERYVRTPM